MTSETPLKLTNMIPLIRYLQANQASQVNHDSQGGMWNGIWNRPSKNRITPHQLEKLFSQIRYA